eukprot:maker-scaffold_6-snap-gene-5.45-mRNA-1 protein AED:0.58 eAED:0.58 QI:0/0/0/0.5/0/0/2/0/79
MKKCNEAREIIAQEDLELGDQDEKRKKVELRFGIKFQSDFKSLHSVILNAGLVLDEYSMTTDGIETIFGANHVGEILSN